MREIRPLIAGNWKMNGLAKPAGREVAKLNTRLAKIKHPAADMLICPPATLLPALSAKTKGKKLQWGGQDCHVAASGAHTGDVSAEMLRDAGAVYCIVGHSERRADHGESSKLVCQKALAAHRAGLVAIVCVGETAGERKAGQTLKVVGKQLRESVPKSATAANLVVAYEPVWAIGTGLTPTEADIAAVHKALRQRLVRRFPSDGDKMRLLYGGSVKPANAKAILAIAHVNGALIGGASLKATDLWGIARHVI